MIGCPTKYSNTTNTKAIKYLEKCIKNKAIPFIEELAVVELKVSDDTVVEWSKTHKDFSATYRLIKTLQKLMLKDKGLTGEYNSNIVKLLLSADHNTHETIKNSFTEELTNEEKEALSALDRK